MRLDGKVAIVTGGAHGMGEAEARLFAKEGAKVVVADILGDRAEAVAASIRASNGAAIAAAIDVTSEPAWVALIAKTVETYGRLDILVNNAGISGSSVGDPDGLDGWERVIAVNQTSVFLGWGKFAVDLYGAFPVKRLFWVVLTVFCSERERPFFVPSPAIRSPERAEGVKGPKR